MDPLEEDDEKPRRPEWEKPEHREEVGARSERKSQRGREGRGRRPVARRGRVEIKEGTV